MHITLHAQRRMSQRGITAQMIDLALAYGYQRGDHHILDRRAIADRLTELNAEASQLEEERKALERAQKRGGLSVVAEHSCIITTFSNAGHKRAAAK